MASAVVRAEGMAPRDRTPIPPRPEATAAPTGAESAEDRAPAPDPAPVAAAEPDPLAPLTEAQREIFLAGEADEPIPVEIHYVQSNETRHDLFFPFIEGVGGAFIGVGSDQSFTLIGAARSELVFLLDIDSRVNDLHEIYRVLIPAARGPEALVEAFASSSRHATLAQLERGLADLPEPRRARIKLGYRRSRETVYRHLRRVLARKVHGQPASWLSDRAMFEHVQGLYRAGRVRVMTGNLAGTLSMRSAGEAARALGIPLRVLYMSNAEEYFDYTEDFLANLQALPTDERSVVLRTIYSKKWRHADLWAYQVQPLSDLRERLGAGALRDRNAMLAASEAQGAVERAPGPKGLSLVAIAAP